MLTLENLSLAQGDFTLTANWSVGTGVTAVVGASGGGKSTLLSAVAGFLAPKAGRVLWKGRDITRHPPGARPASVLFQDNNLFPHLTIAQNVGLGVRPDLRLDQAERAGVTAVLEQVGLAGLEARKPGALSGGQQSRAALARVLLADRPIVLLDEPFAALGPGLRAEMLDLMRVTLTGRTVLMVTHDPADAQSVADQMILVAEGRAQGPVDTDTLFANPPAALRNYLGAR